MIIQHCVIDLFAKSSYLFQDPKLYVQTILNVHKKYNVLVVTAFRSDAGFVAALDKVRLLEMGHLVGRCCLLGGYIKHVEISNNCR